MPRAFFGLPAAPHPPSEPRRTFTLTMVMSAVAGVGASAGRSVADLRAGRSYGAAAMKTKTQLARPGATRAAARRRDTSE